jgi:hypothetical protein
LGAGVLGDNGAGTVYALAVSGTDLYAGGTFTTAGGLPANRIAKWNGSAWSALGAGIGPAGFTVYALTVSGTDLYAGGDFTTAGGVPAIHIAKWNGSAWSPLGSGVGSENRFTTLEAPSGAFALATDASSHLIVGGGFSLAGTNVSPFIAQANVGSLPPVAPNQTFTRAPNLTLKIRIADVLAACSNPGGGTLAFQSVGASAQGATISTTATHILYSLAANANDSLPYTINNGQGGATTGALNVQVGNPGGLAQGVSPSGGSVTVNFAGIPGYLYDIQRATDPGGPWATVATQTAPANGLFSYTDPSPPQPTAYYRLMHNGP